MKKSLSASVNFNDNENFQAVYSSQLYGTFFMIYARFETDYDEDDKAYQLKKAELFLANYKGTINLGIVQAEFFLDKKSKEAGFKIEVQALYESKPKDLIVNNIDEKFKFYRGNSNLHIVRKTKRMHQVGKLSANKAPAIKNGIFDDEFFYREGPIMGDYTALKRTIRPEEWSSKTAFDVGGGGYLCPKAKNQIL